MKIIVTGLNHVRLLNAVVSKSVKIHKPTSNGKVLRFFVEKKDITKVVAILDAMCYNYQIEKPLDRFFDVFWRKLPLACCVTFIFVALFLSNLFVWRVSIDGVESTDMIDAVEIVNNDLGAIALKGGVDVAKIERDLLLGNVVSSSAYFDGNVLMIRLLEGKSAFGFRSHGSFVESGFDAVVTRVITESGTPLVEIGDVVKKGERLIEPCIYSTLDGNVLGDMQARGKVFGKVTFCYVYPVEGVSFAPSGRSQTFTSLSLFGLTLFDEASPYDVYDVKSYSDCMYPFPVIVKRTTFEELAVKDSDGIDEFMREKESELSLLYGGDFVGHYSIDVERDERILKTYFTAEIIIGEV